MAALKNYLEGTPQTEQADSRQVQNAAGGYTFKVDDLMYAKRFLMMGSEGGTLYLSESKLSIDNLKHIKKLANERPQDLAKLMDEIQFKVIKNDYLILALAILWSTRKDESREAAENIFYDIIRIPTHLFMFLSYLKAINGKVIMSRRLRKLINKFYNPPVVKEDTVFYNTLKYQYREGFSNADVLRLAHVKPKTEELDRLFHYIVGKKEKPLPENKLFQDFIALREAGNDTKKIIKIIESNPSITWEMIPSHALANADVWRALLPNLPATALIRNLGRLSALKILEPLSEEAKMVAAKISDPKFVKRAKIHPINAVIAQRTYTSGGGIFGKLSWKVNNSISEALETMVWNAFNSQKPTGKKFFVGIDVSGSMWWNKSIKRILTPGEAAGIMALALVKAEGAENVHTTVFSEELKEIDLTKYTTLDKLFYRLKRFNFGGTDCALPIVKAIEQKLNVDTFITLTDNETWYGKIHPYQALKNYRNQFNPKAKNIVCAFESTMFSIADPDDPYSIDIVGFDPSLPQIIQEFTLFES